MSKPMRLVLASAVMTAMMATLFAIAPAAGAKNEDVIARGSCTGASRWRLELGTTAGGKIEVDYKVFSVAGQTWRVVARHNGAVYFRGSRVSHDSPSHIEVDRFVRNKAGTDHFKVRATDAMSGQVCVGTASI